MRYIILMLLSLLITHSVWAIQEEQVTGETPVCLPEQELANVIVIPNYMLRKIWSYRDKGFIVKQIVLTDEDVNHGIILFEKPCT